ECLVREPHRARDRHGLVLARVEGEECAVALGGCAPSEILRLLAADPWPVESLMDVLARYLVSKAQDRIHETLLASREMKGGGFGLAAVVDGDARRIRRNERAA